MNVSAVIVTRGNVDLQPLLDSLLAEWERVVWTNGRQVECWYPGDEINATLQEVPDLGVYGRYAAIEHAAGDLIFCQDDDVIVSDPQAIVDAHMEPRDPGRRRDVEPSWREKITANMPQEFRHDGYTDSCLVGFGACFHRDLPARAFERFFLRPGGQEGLRHADGTQWFHRTCDVVFTTLTPRVLVDVPKVDREFASDLDRMWRQPNHVGERTRMLELARKVRDA